MAEINQLTAKLVSITQKKRSLYNILYELTKKQANSIVNDEFSSFSNLISEKQSVIDSVNKLDDEFNLVFDEIKKKAGIRDISQINQESYPEFRQLQELILSLKDIAQKIQAYEKSNSKGIKILQDNVADEISLINSSKKVTYAYGTVYSKTAAPYFYDKKK